jgi:hypothetical protein
MRYVLAVSLLVLGACDDAPPAATLKEIPTAFLGSWDASGECGAGGALAVTVTPTEVVFPDSKIAVTGVAPDGETAARVDGHFTSSDAQWEGAVRLELANGGQELNVVNGSSLHPRVRCR